MKNKRRFFSINMASMMKILKNSETKSLISFLSSKNSTRLEPARPSMKKKILSLMLKQVAWVKMTTTWKSLTSLVSHSHLKNRRKWKKVMRLITKSSRGERLSMISSASSRMPITSLRFNKVVACKILTLQKP